MLSTTPRWRFLLYPELKHFEPSRQADALKAAADIRFDAIEYVGLAIALAATVLLTRYSATDMGLANRFGAAIANFIVAIPLLLVLAGRSTCGEHAEGCARNCGTRQRQPTAAKPAPGLQPLCAAERRDFR